MLIYKDKIAIICEIAQTYEGSFAIAEQLVQAAIAAEADAVKFQVFTADELAAPDHKHYQLFKKLELSPEQWQQLIGRAHAGGILAMADVFGITSAKMLLSLGIDGFKIHSTDIKNTPLLEFLSQSNKPLLLSIGGSTRGEIEKAVAVLQKSAKNEIVLMHGFQSYPTLAEHTNLNKIKLLQKSFNLPVGFADHIDGDHKLKFDLCAIALGAGAKVLEKHITLDRKLRMEDYESALDPTVFKEFVAHIRQLERSLGEESFNLSVAEQTYRDGTKKHVVAARDLPSGSKINSGDVRMKRTSEEYQFQAMEDIIGRTLIKPVSADRVIKFEDLASEQKQKRVVAAIACRVQSSRLYGKPLQLLDLENNITILGYLLGQLQTVPEINQIVLAISAGEANQPLVDFAKVHNLDCIVGDEQDVLGRLIAAGRKGQADIVFRITSECPFVYLDNFQEVLEKHITNQADLTVIEHLPECVYYELINLSALERAHRLGEDRHRSEFCSLYINEHPEKFKIQKIDIGDRQLRRPDIRITVDYPEDLIVVREIYKALKKDFPHEFIAIKDIINYLDGHPELKEINSWIEAGPGRIWA